MPRMPDYKEHQCDGALCMPLYYAKEGGELNNATVNFCRVDEATGELPEGWGWYPRERKLRCPRCVKHKEGAK